MTRKKKKKWARFEKRVEKYTKNLLLGFAGSVQVVLPSKVHGSILIFAMSSDKPEVDYSATVEVAIPQAKEIAKSVRDFVSICP